MAARVRRAEDAAERVLCAHEATFDIQRGYACGDFRFAGYGEYHAEASRYVLSKRAKLWEATAHEYLYIAAVDYLDAQGLDAVVAFMETEALGKVKPGPNHMSSYLSLAIVADAVEADALRKVRRTRFRKSFKGGWHGWADLRLAVADLSAGTVVSNGQGKPLAKTMRANIA